jgi:hypothetical protein
LLHQFQQSGQRRRGEARADAGQCHGKPEAGGIAPGQDRSDHARWQLFKLRSPLPDAGPRTDIP